MVGTAQKPADQLKGHSPRQGGEVIPLRSLDMDDPDYQPPAAPPRRDGKALDPVAVIAWDGFWRSPLARLVREDSDQVALRRWALALDELERLQAQFDADDEGGMLTYGSTGQPKLHPFFDRMKELRSTIERIEERFGMDPLSRMRLGIAFAEAQQGLADLVPEDTDGDDGDVEWVTESAR